MKRYPIKKDRTMLKIIEHEVREELEERNNHTPQRTPIVLIKSKPFGNSLRDLWPK